MSLYRLFLIAFVLLFIAVGGAVAQTPDSLLVDVEWLAANNGRDDVVVIDFGRSEEDYLAAHIPGARHIDRAAVYDTVDGVNGMLPPPDKAVPYFEQAGISNVDIVIIYDTIGGLWASRLFWGLEYFGHERVFLLDGGLQAWERAGNPISDTIPQVTPANFYPRLRPELVADTSFISASLGEDDVQVIDSRSAAEYTGSDVRAERGGHIPGAINIDWSLNLDGERQFLPLTELAEFYDSNDVDPDKAQVAHCQTGVRGAHTYFVLRLLGYKDVRLYDESWVVWGNSESTPIDTE